MRLIFQPSRVLLAIVGGSSSAYNAITLCFHTWCSYSPLLYAVLIQKSNYSSRLFSVAEEFVLSVPGTRLLQQVIFCGTHSGRDCNKIPACGLQMTESQTVTTPSVLLAMANMELSVDQTVDSGDHLMVIGKVRTITISDLINERPLLSIGPNPGGYEVLWRCGIHTIGVIPANTE